MARGLLMERAGIKAPAEIRENITTPMWEKAYSLPEFGAFITFILL
jgi:hypothetical protein